MDGCFLSSEVMSVFVFHVSCWTFGVMTFHGHPAALLKTGELRESSFRECVFLKQVMPKKKRYSRNIAKVV